MGGYSEEEGSVEHVTGVVDWAEGAAGFGKFADAEILFAFVVSECEMEFSDLGASNGQCWLGGCGYLQ